MKGFLLFTLLLSINRLAFSQAQCNSADYRRNLLRNSPHSVANAESIESFIKNRLQSHKSESNNNSSSGSMTTIINLPVVVHIVYNSEQQDISDAQVRSQIDVLNKDYARLNADTVNTPEVFRKVAANCGFQFALAKVDSLGYATTGIVRRPTSITAFSISDEIKFSSEGGDDAWDPNNYLNIWVGNLTSGILGYSSVVGGPIERDGVVILYTAFGTLGTANAPFNGGRTATHEIGHWLDLIHTWGDADCGDDLVSDTPPQETADRGCPDGNQISCHNGPNGDMYMNFMDFTNDNCMNLFTQGQRERMQALFAPGGPRYNLLFSPSLTAIPKPSLNSSSSSQDNGGLISIYPNPASDIVVVDIPGAEPANSRLEIFNGLGQRVLVFSINQQKQRINISSLKKGVYLIDMVNGKSRFAGKLVKI